MEKSKTTVLAHELAAFCQQRTKKRSSRSKLPRIAEAVLNIVIAALLAPSPDGDDEGWGRS